MALPRLSTKQIRELNRRGQQDFRRRLATEDIASAKRLRVAYQKVRQQLDERLTDLGVIAQEQGMTTRALASEAAVVRLREATQEALDDFSRVIEREARTMQQTGISAGIGYGNGAITATGLSVFNQPSVANVQALINYVDSEPFQFMLSHYDQYHASHIADIILTGDAAGKGPRAVARQITGYVREFPLADAQRTTRTVQLWAARSGTQQMFRANSQVVRGWVWSSARDNRTCPACWAMHGTKHSIDEVLNGHHLCRCAMIPITLTWAELGFDDGVDVAIQSGESAFRELPDREQRQILGPARYRAWQDGAFQFNQLARTYTNDVYGEMRGEASLEELVGPQAARQYRRAA